MNGTCEVSASRPAAWRREIKILAGFAGLFVVLFYLPVGVPRFDNALKEGLELTKWYAQEHVLLCLVPALFIAGGISVFVNQASVMRYLGPKASKPLAYGVASVSGTILAVCSCTVLPLFGGIWKRGAGLGPATAFLYSGPAINVLAIVMTARILGMELGVARAVGAVVFSVVVGLAMHWVFRRGRAGHGRMPRPGCRKRKSAARCGRTYLFRQHGGRAGVRQLEQAGGRHRLLGDAFLFGNGRSAAVFALGLGASLGLWFGFRWTGLAWTAAAVTIAAPAVAAGAAGGVHHRLRGPDAAVRAALRARATSGSTPPGR